MGEVTVSCRQACEEYLRSCSGPLLSQWLVICICTCNKNDEMLQLQVFLARQALLPDLSTEKNIRIAGQHINPHTLNVIIYTQKCTCVPMLMLQPISSKNIHSHNPLLTHTHRRTDDYFSISAPNFPGGLLKQISQAARVCETELSKSISQHCSFTQTLHSHFITATSNIVEALKGLLHYSQYIYHLLFLKYIQYSAFYWTLKLILN